VTTPSSVQVNPKHWLGVLVKAVQLGALYLIHLGLAWLISYGLRHGFHFDTGYVGLSFLTYFGSLAAMLISRDVSRAHGKSKRAGELAADEAHMQAKLASLSSDSLMALAGQLGLGGAVAPQKAAADDSDTLVGNYL
jgi:divalent metal cation (Fe/Co/Zn/Cd) transporter